MDKDNIDMHGGASAEIFRFAKELRWNMTAEEKRLWEYLRTKPLGVKFRRQHPFYRYILDFYCHKAKLVVEVDGAYHEGQAQKELDALRTKVLEDFGLQELRFTNDEIRADFEKVKKRIVEALEDNL